MKGWGKSISIPIFPVSQSLRPRCLEAKQNEWLHLTNLPVDISLNIWSFVVNVVKRRVG